MINCFFQMMYEKEARIQIDYSSLYENYKELDEPEDVRKTDTKLNKHLNDLLNTIHKIQVHDLLQRTINFFFFFGRTLFKKNLYEKIQY